MTDEATREAAEAVDTHDVDTEPRGHAHLHAHEHAHGGSAPHAHPHVHEHERDDGTEPQGHGQRPRQRPGQLLVGRGELVGGEEGDVRRVRGTRVVGLAGEPGPAERVPLTPHRLVGAVVEQQLQGLHGGSGVRRRRS